MTAKTSVLLWLVARNLPLGHCDQYSEGDVIANPAWSGSWSDKERERIARLLVNGLSQYKVAKRLAEEWDILPSIIRMKFTHIANSPGHSGNVRKGIAYANQLTGRKILRHETGLTERKLAVVDGRVVSTQERVDPAVAGASRAFAAFVRPPNYEKLSPAEKRRINQRLAAERRQFKKK